MVANEIIQVRLVDLQGKDFITLSDGTVIRNGYIFPRLVRRSSVQSFIDQGILEQVPLTTAIPLKVAFGDIEVVGSRRVNVPIGPSREQTPVLGKSVTYNSTTYKTEALTNELNYFPVTLIVSGMPTTFSLDYPRFSSSTDNFPDSYSFATIRRNPLDTPKPLDTFDNFKDYIVLNPGQILNCRLNPRIADLEAKGKITISNITVNNSNIPTPQNEIGPSPQGLPFPNVLPDPLFMWVDFYGWINSLPMFPEF